MTPAREITKTVKGARRQIAMLLALLCILPWLANANAQSAPQGSAVENRAVATAGDANGNPLPPATDKISSTLQGGPRLTVAGSASSDPVGAGSQLTYTLAVANTGNAPAAAVVATLTLPEGTSYLDASTGISYDATTKTATIAYPSLTQGTQQTHTVTVRVDGTLTPGTLLTAQAQVKAPDGSGDRTSITTTVGTGSNLRLILTATPGAVAPGGEISYVLAYANGGNAAAEQVRLIVPRPAGASSLSETGTPPALRLGTGLVWELGTLLPGSRGEVTCEVVADKLLKPGETVSGQATLQSTSQTVAAGANTPIQGQPSLKLTIAAPPQVRAGQNLALAFTATNDGTATLTGVMLTTPLPEGTSYLSADQGGTNDPALNTVRWPLGNLLPGSAKTVHLTVSTSATLGEGAKITFDATGTAAETQAAATAVPIAVTARTPGIVLLGDTAGNPAIGLGIGQTLQVKVIDPDRNTDPSASESLSVTVADTQTGDAETLTLTETGPDTGIFTANLPTSGGTVILNNGTLSMATGSSVEATYTDPLDAGGPVKASAMVDPVARVFDSATGQPLGGVSVGVRLWNDATQSCDLTAWPIAVPGRPNPAMTDSAGRFAFPALAPGKYCYQITTPVGYGYPSLVADSALPAGFTISAGSRGGEINLSPGESNAIPDIPLDPPAGRLLVTKTVDKSAAEIGDRLTYTITVTNQGDTVATGLRLLDLIPHGVSPIKGKVLVDGARAPDLSALAGGTATLALHDLDAGKSLTLSYVALIGPDATRGNGRNTAWVTATCGGRPVTSNRAVAKTRITGGIFTEKGTILGKVYVDRNGDGLQSAPDDANNAPGEEGMPGVVLYLEDGTRVITDQNGKYSLTGIPPGTHVLRLDPASLPKGAQSLTTHNRFLGDGGSQVVAMKPGGLAQADFSIVPAAAEQAPKSETTGAESATAPPRAPKAVHDWEEEIKSLTPALAFLTPADGSAQLRDRIRVAVKSPEEVTLLLTVNGEEVGESHLGQKIDYRQGRVTVREYVDVPLREGGENILEAEIKDLFGITRGTARINVTLPGEPDAIRLIPEPAEAPADGESKIAIRVELLDKAGRRAPRSGTMTVTATAGELVDQDGNPLPQGNLLGITDGEGLIILRAPRETGEAQVTASTSGREGTVKVRFKPHLRDLILVGLGELTIGKGTGNGDLELLRENSTFGQGGYARGRGAFFVKGEVAEDLVLTAAYDSAKKKRQDYFRENDTTDATQENYPIYGDESKQGHEALSRDQLYVKLEKDRTALTYGDYRTEFTDTRLSAYNRVFTGAKFDHGGDKLKMRAFASRTDQTQVVDALPGKGISGYYFLTSTPVVEGSEGVVLETRDRTFSDTVISRRALQRGSDYEIDYNAGTLLFKEPVPTRDSSRNPVYILASYESRGGPEKYAVVGGRASISPTAWLEIGATRVTEEKKAGDYILEGGDVTITLPGETRLQAEAAQTRSLFAENSLLTWKKGYAWSVDLASHPTEKLSLSGYYRSVGESLLNPSATDVGRGATEHGAEAAYLLGEATTLTARYSDEHRELEGLDHRQTAVGAKHLMGETKIEAELTTESSGGTVTTPPAPGSLIQITRETPRELTAARLSVETRLTPDLTATLAHRNNLGGDTFLTSQAGLNYRLNADSRLYVREEYEKNRTLEENRTLLGIESEVRRDTIAYNEYRLADGADGSRNQSVLGLRNKFYIGTGLTGNASAEYLKTLKGTDSASDPDAFAAALGFEYLASEETKITTRYEHRDEIAHDGRKSNLFEVGFARRFDSNTTLLLRERYFTEEAPFGGQTTSRAMVGLAIRPRDENTFSSLLKLERKNSRNTAAAPVAVEEAWIMSGETVWQKSPALQLAAKYAGKISTENDCTAYTDLLMGKMLYDLASRWDVGAEYRLLTSHKTDQSYQGGALEVGYRVVKNFWVALGYSFDKFDADLAGDSYQGMGPYLKLRLKMDENVIPK